MGSVSSPAMAGALLAGKFRIERVLGRGAMGIVYEASDEKLGRRVAIKVLPPDLLQEGDYRQRFDREARIAASLTSEHAVHIHEVGEDVRGAPFLVMELLEGRPLDAVLASDGIPTVSTAVGWILEALHAIAEAHALGLVHRDIKPGNLFLTERVGRPPLVKVLDFGLAKKLDSSEGVLTTMGAVMGTPAYMAPEQIRAEADVDQRADVWAVGVTLFELLTGGQLPFPGPTVTESVRQILEDEPMLGTLPPEVSPEVIEVLQRCLAKERAQRFPDGAALRTALGAPPSLPRVKAPSQRRLELALGDTVALPQANRSIANAPPEPIRTRAAQPAGQAPRTRSSNARVFVISVAVVVVLGIVLFFAVGRDAFERRKPTDARRVDDTPAPPASSAPSAVPIESAPPLPPASASPPPQRSVAQAPVASAPDAGRTAPRARLENPIGFDPAHFPAWRARVQSAFDRCGTPVPPCSDVRVFPNDNRTWVGATVVVYPGALSKKVCTTRAREVECVVDVMTQNRPPTKCDWPTTYGPCEASLDIRFE
jgi:serine/threonine protein kinase